MKNSAPSVMTEEFEEGEPVVIIGNGESDFPKYAEGEVGMVVEDFKDNAPYRYAVEFENSEDFNYFSGDELVKICQTHRCKPVYSTEKQRWICPFCLEDE